MKSIKNLALFLFKTLFTFLLYLSVSSVNVKEITKNLLNHSNHTSRKIQIAVLGPADEETPYSLNKTLPSILFAIRTIEAEAKSGRQKWLGGWEDGVELLYRDTQCSSTLGPLAAFDFYTTSSVDIFLGPLCPYVLAPVARYSSIWGIPILTTGGQEESFDHKEPQFRSLTRMNGSFLQVGLIFVQLLQRFQWEIVALVFHDFEDRSRGHSNCFFTLSAVYTALGRKMNFHTSFDETKSDNDYNELLTRISKKARIIVMCGSTDAVRQIMLSALDLGMVDSGEYAFFDVELFTSQNGSRRPWFQPEDQFNNDRAQKAFQALFKVRSRIPESTEYLDFSNSIKDIAKNQFGYSYGHQDVSTFVTAFHEAVYLYALALNETIAEGFSSRNGNLITRKMWNRTYSGITGNVSIDGNGDRNVDYSLLNMNPKTGNYEVVSNYYGVSQQFVDVPNKQIYWAGGRTEPPFDTPECGFEDEKCVDDLASQYAIISGVLTGLLLVLFIFFIILYRHYKLEAELASMTWKIRFDDIITYSSGIHNRPGFGSRMSLTRTSISSDTLPLVDQNKSCQVFARTGLYKGIVVAIKPIDKLRVDITRTLLIELKHMKDLQHNHVVRFLGACMDPPNCCIVTEYCPKGSLQDILENDEIKLDWMFRYSLMHDIIKGMAYLHNSEMHCHGNLKSSNCVVDSRFVLKITDFGLHTLRKCDFDTDSYAFWRKKLWTAPELLRNKEIHPKGTQKGDVYSFAIIAHEIVLRQGPYYCGTHCDLSPREIVQSICEESLRPLLEETMADEEVLAMIRKCWSEDVNERPDFVSLQSVMRKVNKANESSNILDNLLQRMEQYANNLESLVQERTSDYLEEKRKAEDLLYQLLPKSVASQLIRGESVRAEAYDSVTIYFSDIVGFTTLSAQSTPMQVVDLLNDLYTCFDSTIESFDVYKVETIGDAYMVVSGLPVRNGFRHAREVGRMALALLNRVKSFKLRHRPSDKLMLRIGLHSGSCVAGVVGLKMPRYCLFGDTVNTASRMESNGAALKIHISETTKKILDSFDTFVTEPRGEIPIKGKGTMNTYWLISEKGSDICNGIEC